MAGTDVLSQLTQKFGDAVVGAKVDALDPWIEIAPAAIQDVCRFLKSQSGLQFEMLNCITVVDYCEPDEKKAKKVQWEPHLELVYHLSSISLKHTLVLKVQLPRWKDDVEGQLPEIDTVSNVWATADWHEREVYDLSGVHFVGHPDLCRILCPEDWVGHPLRKDYQMPLEYHGIRGR
ncbi:MAG: NADH-quinone oxidoreductase subunit C [Planctomycetales bacterium]|nr:NADH-quinone oxidoreductase subunit C [Planctomycetales bacterium]